MMIRCELCGIDHKEDKIKKIPVKGKVKNICDGCLAEIKGFA